MRTLQTVAALTCMKTLLLIFNVLFWLSGILLLILGVWLHVELGKFTDLMNTTPNESSASTAPFVLIGTGVLILFLATLACCCTVNEQPILLYVYAAFLTIIFVVETTATASGYAYRTQLSENFEQGLNTSMQVYNKDFPRTSAVNSLQAHVHCCGVTSPRDWYSTPYGRIPGSCCRKNIGCDTKDARLVYPEGCHSLVTGLITANFGLVGWAALCLALFQLLGVALAILLAKLLIKTKYEQMS